MTSDDSRSDSGARTTADGCPVRSLISANNAPDPQAVYRQMREEQGDVARVELEPGVHAWLVLGWNELRIAASHEHLYSHDSRNWKDLQDGVVPLDSGLLPMIAYRDAVLYTDLDEHRRLRRPLHEAISAIDERKMRRSVEAICAELIAGFAEDGSADLVADYAAIVPMLAIGNLFGLDNAASHELRGAMIALLGGGDDAEAGNRRMEEIFAELLASRRAVPADDLTSVFVGHPDYHHDGEILQAVLGTILGGDEISLSWIAQTLRLMLTDQRFSARMRGGRLGIDDALNEVLWTDPPAANVPARFALRDTVLGGRRIAKGDILILCLTAANADPRIHTGNDRLEFGNQSHLAWGAGPHACPGRIPARIIARTAVETALHLLRGVRLTIAPEDVAYNPSPWMRCPTSLPVTFNATTIPAPKPQPGRPARIAQPSR